MGAGTRDMADTALHNFTSVDAAAILENVTDGMGLFEANGDIALWNGAMFAINGFPRQLFIGFRNISQAFHWQFENGHLERSHPSVEADVAAFMTRFLSGDAPRNGQQSVLAVDAIALMDAVGVDEAIVAVHVDGTPDQVEAFARVIDAFR